jgi:hypothetical protein
MDEANACITSLLEPIEYAAIKHEHWLHRHTQFQRLG